MTQTRYRILLALRQAEHPLCLSDLVGTLAMSVGTVSMQLTRCHRGGLVGRREHLVWLTEKGAKRVDWMTTVAYGTAAPTDALEELGD